jgi:23S rRNA pseudouridine1911/1915/1917 synthase
MEKKAEILPVSTGQELLEFLLGNAGGRSRTSMKAFLKHGQVFVNGKCITRFDHPLQAGDTVSIGGREKERETGSLHGVKIVYEDEHLLVINKRAGLLSVATDKENENTAFRILSSYVRQSDPRCRIFVLHRLDREASGLMMFAKSQQVQEKLQKSWQESVQERSYAVLVEGRVKEEEGSIRSWLKENRNLLMYSSREEGDGQLAISHFRRLKTGPSGSVLEVQLETGRKNQIRVHMKDLGHPIAGDRKYGAKSDPIHRLGLHAMLLQFTHPVTGELKRFETPVPPEFMKAVGSEWK